MSDLLNSVALERAHGAIKILRAANSDNNGARTFTRALILRALSFSGPDKRPPEIIARERWGRDGDEVADEIRKSTTAALTGTTTAGAQAFFDVAANASLIGKLPLRRWPFDTATLASASAIGNEVPEGYATPIRAPSLATFKLTPRKFQSATVLTRESLLACDPSVEKGIEGDLVQAVADAVDAAFVADITGAAGTFGGNRLHAVYVLNPSDASARADILLNVQGGTLYGCPAYTSNAVPIGSALLFDASQVATNWTAGAVDYAEHAAIQQDTAPANPTTAGTSLVSLWQNNCVGVRATMFAGWRIGGTPEIVSLAS
ncbi:MAG: hypothetical protein QM741_18590 [Rudaea sp.]|uniref:hypothetical protein n=1 Tax=Rudaea sp. TaxID=2136325 RepID=UPI0039E5C7CB